MTRTSAILVDCDAGNIPIGAGDPARKQNAYSTLFAVCAIIGVALRLVALYWGDYAGDPLDRMALAIRWAEHPHWIPLKDVWPPLPTYLLGILQMALPRPVLVSRLTSLAAGLAGIGLLRSAARSRFGSAVANIAASLLALHWAHIALTSGFYSELPTLALMLAAVGSANRSVERRESVTACLAGLCLGAALLIRHEVLLLVVVFQGWYWMRTRRLAGLASWFGIVPWLTIALVIAEPLLHGSSYLRVARAEAAMKAAEQLANGTTRLSSLARWGEILFALPSILVIAPALLWLWRHWQSVRADLWFLTSIAPLTFYVSMSALFGWWPQTRYVMLYTATLLPFAALQWIEFDRELGRRWLMTASMAGVVLIQGSAWWLAANRLQPLGWLPLHPIPRAQTQLNVWVSSHASANRGASLMSIVGDPESQRATVTEAYLANGLPLPDTVTDYDVTYLSEFSPSSLPANRSGAACVFANPAANYFPRVAATLRSAGFLEMENLAPTLVLFKRQCR